MKNFFITVLVVLGLVGVPAVVAYAAPPMIESGGTLFFPRITTTDTVNPSTFGGPVILPNASAPTPSITGTGGESTTGFYWPANGSIGISSQGALAGTLAAASFTYGAFIPSSATVPTNGLFLPGANAPAISVNSTETFRFPAAAGTARQVLTFSGSGGTADTTYRTADFTWGATCFTAAGTNSCEADTTPVFQGVFKPSTDGHVNVSLNCSWAGENTGAGVVVGAIFDCGTSAGACGSPSTLCSCTLDADCTSTSANVPMSCACAGTYSANHYYKVTLTSATTCATNSPGQVVCNPIYTE